MNFDSGAICMVATNAKDLAMLPKTTKTAVFSCPSGVAGEFLLQHIQYLLCLRMLSSLGKGHFNTAFLKLMELITQLLHVLRLNRAKKSVLSKRDM